MAEEEVAGISIDPDEITKYVSRVIAESSIGEALKKVVDEEVRNISSSFNNPMKPVVQKIIHEEVEKLVREDFVDKIRKQVAKKVDDKFVGGLVDSFWETWSKENRGW